MNRFLPVICHAGHGAEHAEAVRQDVLRRDPQAADREHAARDQALVERAHDRAVGAELDEERADDRGHDAGAADAERIEHRGRENRLAREEDRGEHHRGDDGHRVGLEQVGGHAGAVADVVAHVVGDGRRVARIVLRDAGLDLADEVGADVGALGEDAAAETGEDRDQRGAERERHQRVDHRAAFRREAARADQEPVVERDAEQRETGDQHAGDGARLERDIEAFGERLRGGLRGADVRAHRDVHADEAGRAGEHRTDQEADRHKCAEQDPQPDEDDRAHDRDGHVLALEIGLRAFGDRGGDLLHFL